MNNNTDHIISNENNVPPVVFIKWPLDMDDDEFRAGYPFTPAQLEEMNEHETWYDVSSTSIDDNFPLVNSQNNDSNEPTKENDESIHCSFDKKEELMEFDVKSSTIHNDKDDYSVNTNQKQDHEEHERNQYDQDTIVQTDNVNGNQTNQAHPAK